MIEIDGKKLLEYCSTHYVSCIQFNIYTFGEISMNKLWIRLALSGVVLGLTVITVMMLFLVRSNNQIKDNSLLIIDTLLRDSFDKQIEEQVETVITKEEARLLAYHMVREARFGETGYFWGDDPDGTNRILYGKDIEGTNRLNLKDVNGYEMVKHNLEVGTTGGGYTDFWFPKEGKVDPQPKRGYNLQSQYYGIVIGTGNYIDDINDKINNYSDILSGYISKAVIQLLVIASFLAVILCITAGFFGLFMSKAIKETAATLEDISGGEGDLTKVIQVKGSEEILRLSSAFNTFVRKLSRIVQSARTALATALGCSEDLVSTSEETSASVIQIGKNSDTIRGLTHNLREHINMVNRSFEHIEMDIHGLDEQIESQVSAVEESTASIVQMTASINSVADKARNKRQSVTELLETTDEGIREIEDAKEAVSLMTSSINELLNITGLINDIADQTNLLSMNASIEAAHAGDFGRGFGVVAGEIRKLAESSAANAASIESTLKKNVNLIKNLEVTTEKSSSIFTRAGDIARETDLVFSEITHAMDELSVGTGEINNAVSTLREVSAGVRHNSRSMNDRLKGLNGASLAMGNVAKNTIESVEEIQLGIAQISEAMENLNKEVGSIVQNIRNVEGEMDVFKV